MIRHGPGGGLLTEAILLLTVAMILPAFLTVLVPPIGASPLPKPGLSATVLAAVAMAAIAMGADEEQGAAVSLPTGPQQENAFAVYRRRHRSLAELDNGSLVMSG